MNNYRWETTNILLPDELFSNKTPPLLSSKNSLGPFLQLLDRINVLHIAASINTQPGSSHNDDKINKFVKEETKNRVRVTKVKFMEYAKNAAYYSE